MAPAAASVDAAAAGGGFRGFLFLVPNSSTSSAAAAASTSAISCACSTCSPVAVTLTEALALAVFVVFGRACDFLLCAVDVAAVGCGGAVDGVCPKETCRRTFFVDVSLVLAGWVAGGWESEIFYSFNQQD